jgi:hypothetical protein
MKSLRKLAVAGVALLMLAAPIAANAFEWHPGYRYGCAPYHSLGWDRHNLHAESRDIHRDRFALRADLASGNWAAARAERADIRHDYFQARRDRFALYHGYY